MVGDRILSAVIFAAALAVSSPAQSVSDSPSPPKPSSGSAPAPLGKDAKMPRSSSSPIPLAGGAVACPARGAPVAEPYRWYPSLDLARIPFHTAAGPWGPRAPIAAPSPPVTQRSVRVTSAAELVAAARVPGTLITVDADYIGHAVLFGDVTDVDIVVPPGRRVKQLTIGSYSPRSTTQRVRIRGTTPGVRSGGLVGSIEFMSNPATDLIIDGVDLNGDDSGDRNVLWTNAWPVQRLAIVNVRAYSVSDGGANYGVDIVIAGNHIASGGRPREVFGGNVGGGWSVRGGDRLVVYDNRIEGNRYHRVRVQSQPGPPQYAWIADNILVDPHEARIVTAFNTLGPGNPRYAAVWAVCNRVYAHSTCMSPSFEATHATYAMLTSNTLYGSITAVLQRRLQEINGPGHDYLSGNTFSAWQAPPAWATSDDPRRNVPLPLVKSERYNAALKSAPCPGP